MVISNRDTEVIKLLRFPLAVLVVFIHSYIVVGGFHISQVDYYELTGRDIYSLFCISFSHVLAQVAVPLFFFISGYLFYLNYNKWSWSKWGDKLKRRFKTLFVPYVTWISIAVLETLLMYIVAYLLKGKPINRLADWYHEIGGVMGIYWNDISHVETFTNILGWECFMTYPYLMPMWFIRDLMVVVLLTPIIWLSLKWIPNIILFLLGGLWVLGVGTKLPGLSISSLFMFSLGGVFSIKSKSFVAVFKSFSRWPLMFVFGVLFVVSVVFDGRETLIGQICLHLWILTAIPFFVSLSDDLLKKRMSFAYRIAALSDTSFFIFALHGRHISYIYILLWIALGISTVGTTINGVYIDAHPLIGIVSYLLTPIITIILCLLVYRLLKRILPPKIMMLLNGK